MTITFTTKRFVFLQINEVCLGNISKIKDNLPPAFYSTDLYVVINNDLFFFGQEGRRILCYWFLEAPDIRHVQLV